VTDSRLTVLESPPVTRHGNGRVPPAPPSDRGDGGEPWRDPDPQRPLIDNARLATLFLITAEVMLFGGLGSGFFMLRLGASVWPPPLQPRLPVLVTGVNTLVLLASSVAMAAAGRAGGRRDLGGVRRHLSLAAALGTLFLAVQGYEWLRLVSFGLTTSSGAYGTTFYTLIGTHAVHVLAALGWLGGMLLTLRRGALSPGATAWLGACAMYWHFVVALWPILYVTVYLL
jgi:heme/copper-type cytochrome/quinol oxidase subunit 3